MLGFTMSLKVVSIIQILFCCFTYSTGQRWVVDDEGCRTPDRGVGTCIPARDCEIIVDFLKMMPRPLPFHITHKLREYICGYEDTDVKVCCPSKPIPIVLPLMRTPEVQKMDLITNHKNLNLLPTECGYIGIPDKISHGENAKIREFPWMALLIYQTSEGQTFKCGGTIINSKYILTAAHCITQLENNEQPIGVRVGEHTISTKVDCEIKSDGARKCIRDPVQDLNIEKVIPHPNFTKNFNNVDGFNDIGLLRVSEMKEADNVGPICLPVDEEVRNFKPVRATITGWGFTENETTTNSDTLQKVAIPLISQQQCQKAHRSIKISNKQLCADGMQQNTCRGDSGGPLQDARFVYDDTRMVQYGIISFGGIKCGAGRIPGLFTNVVPYLDWILNNIEP